MRDRKPGGGVAPLPDLTDRERQVLTLLRREGAVSRAALIRLSGLTGPAIFRVTGDLEARGLIELGEPMVEGRGQPSHRVSLKSDAALTLGLAVMTDMAEAVLMNLSGAVVARADFAEPAMDRAAILEAAFAFARTHADGRPLVAAGLAVAGFFTGEDRRLNTADALDDWALIDLAAEVEDRLGLPAFVENIANAAAMGEQMLGLGRRYHSFAYVSVASGFGGGLVLDGRLWRGAWGNAGEFAALLSITGQPTPNLETLRDALADQGVTTTGVGDLLARFDDDWPGVDAWVAWAAPAVRKLALMTHYALDVQALVLGGRLPTSLAARLAEASRIDPGSQAQRIRRGRAHPIPDVVAAEIPSRSAAIGAAALPLAAAFFSPLVRTSPTGTELRNR